MNPSSLIIKNFLFPLLGIILLLSSCSKDEPGSNNNNATQIGELSFSADGVSFTFKNVFATIDEADGISGFGFAGSDLVADRGLSLSIERPSREEFRGGSMLKYSENDVFSNERLAFLNLFSINDQSLNAVAFSGDQGSFEIRFSELDYTIGGDCKGTFSGVLIDDYEEIEVIITDGKFNLRII